MGSIIKTTITILCASALAAGAARAVSPSVMPSWLLGSAVRPVAQGTCPEGMVPIPGTDACIDRYEASPTERCPFQDPGTLQESLINNGAKGCIPASVPEALPWRNVSQSLAAELCAKAGKRLATGAEWFAAALGTPGDASCNLGSNAIEPAGTHSECASGAGASDMVGNAWEWTSETVRFGALAGVPLPSAGFVASADLAGTPLSTAAEPTEAYGGDRLWIDPAIVAGVMRGGYSASEDDGGIYAVFASSPPSFSGSAVGFRCVR